MPAWSGSLPTSTCPCRTTIATRPCGSTPTRSRECRRSRSRPDSRKRAPMSARWSISAICRNEAADARAAMPRPRSRHSIGRRNSQSLVRWGIVMCGTGKGALRRLTCLLALLAMSASAALAQGATLRLGYGTAAEEPIWLLVARPDLAKNQGKAYALDATRFTGSDKRGQAFEAGAIDLAASSANGVIFAAAEGVTARIIASVSRESSRGFSTSFYVKESSPVRSVSDLKGKVVGINGFYTSGHLWLKTALEKHGLAETDVTITPVPFPAMQEALDAGKVDLGQFPQPFAALAEKQMK